MALIEGRNRLGGLDFAGDGIAKRVTGTSVAVERIGHDTLDWSWEGLVLVGPTGGRGVSQVTAQLELSATSGCMTTLTPRGAGWSRVEPGGAGWSRVEPGGASCAWAMPGRLQASIDGRRAKRAREAV